MAWTKAGNQTIKVNGATLTGRPEDLARILESMNLDPSDFGVETDLYYSESKGKRVKISSMQVQHLKNAVVKLFKAELDNVAKLPIEQFSESVYNGFSLISADLNQDANPVLESLLNEVAKRAEGA